MREALHEGDDEEVFELWKENVRAFDLFVACRRQWTFAPMGGAVGLRAEGVESVLRMKSIPLNEQYALFTELQMMTDAAIPILNARDEEDI